MQTLKTGNPRRTETNSRNRGVADQPEAGRPGPPGAERQGEAEAGAARSARRLDSQRGQLGRLRLSELSSLGTCLTVESQDIFDSGRDRLRCSPSLLGCVGPDLGQISAVQSG